MKKTNLEKNLEQISRYNPILAKRILDHEQLNHDFELLEARSGDVILSYNGVLLHDDVDPQDEAIRIFSSLSSDLKSNIHVLYGLGLGYLFKLFSERAKGKIIVFEPNLDILRITFELVDFSAELSKDKIQVANTLEDVKQCYEKLFFLNTKTSLSFLSSYAKNDHSGLLKFQQELGTIDGLYSSNYKTLFEKSEFWIATGLTNIPGILKSSEVEVLRDKFKNKPAVIISAGPSLDKCVDELREHQDKFVIFCVGTAYKTAIKHGIKPDFLVMIECFDTSGQLNGIDVSDVNLILQPITHYNVQDLKVKNKLNFYPNNDFITQWIARYLDVDIQDYINQGSVSVCAFHSAKIMGCNPIILVGQDLAFTDGKCYSKDSAYSITCKVDEKTGQISIVPDDLDDYIKTVYRINKNDKIWCNQVDYMNHHFEEMAKNICFVKGQNENMLPTEPGYASFIKYFEQTAQNLKDKITLINASTGGAYIGGFEHIPFKDVIKLYAGGDIDTQRIIDDSINMSRDLLKEKGPTLIKALTEANKLLSQFKGIFEKGRSATLNFNKELKSRGIHSQNILKSYKEIIAKYLFLEENMVVKNQLLQIIFYTRYSQFVNYLKNADSVPTEDDICNFINIASFFFIYLDLNATSNLLQGVIDSLNENSNSKSKESIC